MKHAYRLRVNGRSAVLQTEGETALLWALRAQLDLTGTKYGCGEGLCGACVVLVDGRPVRSCTTTVKATAGKDVLTVEGLARGGRLHPLQQAFIEQGAVQCGYCTPGMLLSAYALLHRNRSPTRADIVAAMDGNLCRCGAHQRIVDAIEAAARQPGGSS